MTTKAQAEEHIEYHRKDDSFLRKMIAGVFVALIIQGVFSVYYAGQLTNQVGNNTAAIAKFAESQKNTNNLEIKLTEIKTVVDRLVTDVGKASDKLTEVSTNQTLIGNKLGEVADEQKRRTELVYGKKK